MRFCTDVETLTGSLYSGYGELLDIPCDFAYKDDNYKKKVREILNAWNQNHRMKRFTANPMRTPEYD
ncbi:hypothetical protein Godav_024837 [Gossypium davidsonii]|uniref:Uncharacterized protein n=1 Tax=Gossypium davidsonii TaxID=34287 RepID=A0A7J8THA6_GOSDV|nr:hypothetical protein [Gossypium davidsonii]